ncbi:multidrug resistance efflux pump [Methylobacterium sp. R2-1]|nr:multidrug resistance efflux pump [Methylobacterium sp. R2-1]
MPPLCARSRRARGVRPKLSPAAATRTQDLPNVDPVYTWVRLAQRVPVRIRIDHVPSEVTLVAGMTATVVVGDGREGQPQWVKSLRDRLFGTPNRTEPGAERKN